MEALEERAVKCEGGQGPRGKWCPLRLLQSADSLRGE